ncbi:hypothetical protein Vretifemale_5278 [Volvox reticuliferus]|uniref:Ionotropic glutamate receptor C-terminal domain-containing protein n=1 Tax=Volvox reticuliferus TaxID=1737510 RepID=A0A8J4C6A6_9CHLO|nr:hypothetical protein Vretifemale_5278 [Volvox reticuliferus]
MTSKPLKVVVAHRPPFVYVRTDTSGNLTYSGLLIELFQKILAYNRTVISYEYYPAPLNAGGTQTDNGQWTGVTGELVNGNADVALFPLTRTAGRLAAIECTYSYLDQGLSLLIQSSTEDPGPLSVLAPFSLTLWVTLLCTVIAISLLFWALDRYGSWIRARQIKALQESGHLPNKPWAHGKKGRRSHVMTSFMAAAGAPERPQRTSWGGQVLYVFYCFFCLIVLSSYTANLTSFLAVQRANEGIVGLQDVVRKSGLIAINANGATASYFRKGQDSLAMQLLSSIRYCDEVDACVTWVRQGHVLAFVSDKATLEYEAMQQPCDLAVVGDPFGPGNLVIGLQKNSSLLPLFNAAMQEFNEDGTLTDLHRSWFDNRSQCGTVNGQLGNSRLSISQMLGAFVFLGIGVLVAFTTGTVENLKWCLLKACCQDGSEIYDLDGAEAGQRSWPPSLARTVKFSRLSTLLLSSIPRAARYSRGISRSWFTASCRCDGVGAAANSCKAHGAAAPGTIGVDSGKDSSDGVGSSCTSSQGGGSGNNKDAADRPSGSVNSRDGAAAHGVAGGAAAAALVAAATASSSGSGNCVAATGAAGCITPNDTTPPPLISSDYQGAPKEGFQGSQDPGNRTAVQSPGGMYEHACDVRPVLVQGIEQTLSAATFSRSGGFWGYGPHDRVTLYSSLPEAAASPLEEQAVSRNTYTLSAKAFSGCCSKHSSDHGSMLPPPPCVDWSAAAAAAAATQPQKSQTHAAAATAASAAL